MLHTFAVNLSTNGCLQAIVNDCEFVGHDREQRASFICNDYGFMPHFGDIPLWNTLASGGLVPYIFSYPCVTTLMRWGHGRAVAPETASLAEGARFRLNTGHHRPDPLVT